MSVKKTKDIDINNVKFKKYFKTIDNNYQIDIKYSYQNKLLIINANQSRFYFSLLILAMSYLRQFCR